MTTTELSALYILCCLLMTGVASKVILMAFKPVLWSEIKNEQQTKKKDRG